MKLPVSFSEFSSEDINADQLALELGLAEYKISREHDETVMNALSLVGNMVQDWPEYDLPQLGAVLQKHEKQIETIFDNCAVSWRLPLHITRDMYFDILIGHGNGEVIFRNIINCWKWYAYNKAQERDVAFYEGKERGTYVASQRAQEEIERMMQGSWGRRHKSWIKMIGAGMRVSEFDTRMSVAVEKFFQQATIIPNIQQLQKEMNKLFSTSNSALFERLFIDNEVSEQNPAIDIPPLNFLLCQTHIACYAELLRNTTLVAEKGISDHIPAWKEWIKKYFDLIVQPDSEVRKSFYYAFSLKGALFENGKIPKKLKRRGFKTTEGIPEELCLVLEHLEQQRRTKLKHERKSSKPAKVVAQIMPPVPAQTAINTLITRATQSEKIVITPPDANTVFPELAGAKKNKKQITHIDLSNCDFPQGTTISIQRSLPARKPVFETIKDINPTGINMIPVVMGNDIRGHFGYRIVVNLPSTHRFAGNNTIEVSYYAEAEPTPEEIEEQKRLFEALKNQPKGPEKTAPVVVEQVEKKVERVIDPVGVSLTAVAMVLEVKKDIYSGQKYSGGPIIITLADDIVDVLGEDAKAVLPEHKQWTIAEDGIIAPAVSDTDVRVLLTDIVDTIRTRHQTEQQQREAELQQQRELEEYEKARKEFEPILAFAKTFRFEGREKGNFETQKSRLRDELDGFGWSMPVALTNNQVIWRHKSVHIKILYTSKTCTSFSVQAETKGNITPATQKCYEEVGEAFAHIARFFNAETRERKKMVTREQAIRKETETGAIAYEKLLAEGRARLVIYNPYQGSYGAWSSKFPTEKKPHMLDERASHATVTSLLEQYPHAELCYRRDQLCINGEIADDAGGESVENTLQNIADLRQSPRARYILTKRILITLGLEKFGGDTSRAPIKHEKNKKEGRFSALDVLHHLRDMWTVYKKDLPDGTSIREKIRQEGYGYKLFLHLNSGDNPGGIKGFYEMISIPEETMRGGISAADIDKEFIDTYIDILEFLKIRVHYTWPLSVRLDEHQKMIQKSAIRLVKPKSTAD